MLRALERSGAALRPVVADHDLLLGRDVEPGDEAGPARARTAAHADRLVQLVGGGRHGAVGHHRGRRRCRPASSSSPTRRACSTSSCGCSTRSPGVKGLVGVGGPQPVGYYKDPEKSARTFVETPHGRFSVPGDWAVVNEDGSTLTLLGRGSVCINTGGEKVFPEEVEEVVKRARRRAATASSSACPTSASAKRSPPSCRATARARRRGAEGLRQGAPRRLQGAEARRASSTRSTAARPARRTSSAPRRWRCEALGASRS